MLIFCIFFQSIFGAEKNATIEFQIANTSKAAFSGELKIYVGKNCNTKVQKGKICDYSFDGSVTYAENKGLTVNKGHYYEMTNPIEPSDDLIFMSYRNKDRAIFKGIRLRVETGIKKQTQIIELFNSKSGMSRRDKYLIFQYHNNYNSCYNPNGDRFPDNSRCIRDATFDLKEGTMSSTDSFLIGRNTGTQTNGNAGKGAKILLYTGFQSDTRGNSLMFYHGFNCGEHICEYNKIGEIRASAQNTTYELDFNDFDVDNDQIIMDIRNGNIRVRDLKIKPCASCGKSDLLKEFGFSDIWMRYIESERHYGSSYYDVIFDFKRNTALLDHSVFAGNATVVK
ncbi:unnamed protein product [Oikopleura dioica]|uniref:Uncharacterized protein n=1 Tax=Oikopleura dioica TaxID=34765 RepID=E4X1X1_OIKDI|nr:unnamed protein product [Oikopleura dioica]